MQNTLHYNLPLFEGEDVPSIIGQWNPTMQLLDTKLYQLSIGNAGPEIIHEIEALIATVNDLIATVNETISDVDELQQTINAVQQTVSSIYEAIGQYSGDISEIQASVDTLTETVSGIDSRVQALEDAPGYTLPTASANELGGIKVGTGLSIDGNGVLSNDNPTPPTPYVLPVADQNTLGGIKVGQNLTIESDGTLNASGGGSSELPIGVLVNNAFLNNKFELTASGSIPNPFTCHVGLLIDMYSDSIAIRYALNKLWDYQNQMWVQDSSIFDETIVNLNVYNSTTQQQELVPFLPESVGNKALLIYMYPSGVSGNFISVPNLFVKEDIHNQDVYARLNNYTNIDFKLRAEASQTSINLVPEFSIKTPVEYMGDTTNGIIDVTNPTLHPLSEEGLIMLYSTSNSPISSYQIPNINDCDDLPSRASTYGAVASYFGYIDLSLYLSLMIQEVPA